MGEKWLNEVKGKRDEHGLSDDELKAFFLLTEFDHAEAATDRAWENIRKKLTTDTKRTSLAFIYRVAAILLVGLGIGFTYYTINDSAKIEYVSVHAFQKEKLTLPDGSSVVLSEGSAVKYPREFKQRNITFSGEAYFDVVKKQSPFTITVGDLRVKVLGTAFNLKSGGKRVDLFVDRGLVSMISKNQSIKVSRGQQAFYDGTTQNLVLDEVPDPNVMSWRTGEFIFKNTPLAEASDYLEKYYNIAFSIPRSFEKCRVSASFDRLPEREVLNILGTILNAKFTLEDQQVQIEGAGCQ